MSKKGKKGLSFCEEEIRGDTAELATKKGRQVFHEKIEGVTPSVAAPGVTLPSDATASLHVSKVANKEIFALSK